MLSDRRGGGHFFPCNGPASQFPHSGIQGALKCKLIIIRSYGEKVLTAACKVGDSPRRVGMVIGFCKFKDFIIVRHVKAPNVRHIMMIWERSVTSNRIIQAG